MSHHSVFGPDREEGVLIHERECSKAPHNARECPDHVVDFVEKIHASGVPYGEGRRVGLAECCIGGNRS